MLTSGDIRARVRSAFRKRPRLTQRGRGVLIGALCCLALGLIDGNVIMVQLSLFFLLLIPFAILASHVNLRGITYDHVLPNTARRNEAFTVELRLENAKPGLGAFDIEVVDDVIFRHRTQPTVFSVGPRNCRTRIASTRIRH
ncbi:hypothetical protein ACFLQU_04575, partial [Verrucomicrobiota bacterium]